MMHDAHFHTDEYAFLDFLAQQLIQGIVNASSPQEYLRLSAWLKQLKGIRISAGIHPWDSDRVSWEEMRVILEQVQIIGEIGLDNVWCEVDPLKQYEIFERQLAYASKHHKPVILHLKGMEKEALPLLRKYQNKYFVHWYSCDAYLDEYIALDCYFSIGPSVYKDRAVQQVAKSVPLDRLLLESDGISALSWCENRHVQMSEYLALMKRSVAYIEALKGHMDMETQLNQNLMHFISYAENT